ncbi:MAG TPA: translation initiation factor IF-3 [Candidatus Paceibacterota bacterium]
MRKVDNKIRINESIRADQVRVIHHEKGNLGVMNTEDALKMAMDEGCDLIEVTAEANPPVVKIMDYGKYQYEVKKKLKEIKSRAAHTTEVKSIQVKTGTGEGDLMTKAKRAMEWLEEGHRIKIELYLVGRSKFIEKDFLQSRLERFLEYIETPFKIVEDFRASPKGIDVLIERSKK